MPSQIANSTPPGLPSAQAAIKKIFDRRAEGFDRVAFLPREIAGRMQERLDYIKVSPLHILDAGCGLGSDVAALTTRYPTTQLAGVDLSAAMLARARANAGATTEGASRWLPDALRRMLGRKSSWLVQADYAALPFADGAFDMVWSNLALQWHHQPDQVFPEWQRVLSVGGLLMFSTLGPDTLRELRAAWREADAAVHGGRLPPVLEFVDMHDFGDMLVASGFELPVMDMETLTITYRDPAALLADVRGWGGYPVGRGRPGEASAPSGPGRIDVLPGLTGRTMHRALLAALERQRRADGTLALTFEIVYGHAWKAQPRTTAEGHAVFRLDDIGGRRRGGPGPGRSGPG